MTDLVFQPKLRVDGSLDPECLELMGQDWLTDWMRERLSGHDPWFPIDRRSDEDPETLIVGLLRGIGSGHPLVPIFSRAARRLLDESKAAVPHPPLYFHPLLRLCQQASLPLTGAWFTAELEALADRPDEFSARWPNRNLTSEILFAALRQSPGWPGTPARPAWKALLSRPASTTFALSALGTSVEEQAYHLAVWWQTCPEEERDLELSQVILEALTTEGEDAVRHVLSEAPSLPLDLQEAINRELRSQGARPLFSSVNRRAKSVLRSLEGSGLRREFLLQDAA